MNEKNLYVVGIGSSAGGMDAWKELFTHMPDNPGVAFVIIYHLLPNVPSSAQEILVQHTRLQVTEATDGTLLKPNYIYLIPANKILTIQDKRLKVTNRPAEHLFPMTIDIFLHSLGNELKENAIGIILSGAGTDGSNGIQTIHDHGGMVLVQTPDTARFDDMPSIAIAADNPDWVMPPKEMGAKLIEYIQNPQVLRDRTIKINAEQDNDDLQEIIQLVSDFSRVNFKHYKLNTVLRRIERRMNINHILSTTDYRNFLQKHPEELRVLYNELLIGVTNFFRDPHAFQALVEKVLPELCKRRAYEPIRVWVAGCSTGVEAYSMAILFDEYIEQHKLDIDYKIFATDLDSRAIEFASYGRYRNTIATEVDVERLRKYFVQTGDFYEVRKEIRRKIIFAKHNLISDPPFIKLDLLTCRNLFIYLKADMQKKLAMNFSYALKPHGYLFMGAHESPNDVEALFEPIDQKWKIFRNKAGNHYRHATALQPDLDHLSVHLPDLPNNHRRKPSQLPTPTYDAFDHYTEVLVNQYAPTCLFVNQNHEITYMHGLVERYLQLPRKRVSFNLFQMVPENLATIFRTGIRKVMQGNMKVSFKNVSIKKNDVTLQVDLTFKSVVDPDKEKSNGASLILIEFLELPKETLSAMEYVMNTINGDAAAEREILNLENELQEAKKELQYTIDELETINEELQASNEEMLSSNEEMQSANEELQSSNEELFTVNTELKDKIDELTLLHNDIKNLLTSTEIATIFLDRNLNIRRFTPSAKTHFNFLDSDIGRPLAHLTHQFDYNSFAEDSEAVLQKLVPIEQEISKKTGQYYILRILPYRTEDSQIIGVVITILDVTELKESNNQLKETTNHLQRRTEELQASEQQWKSLVDNTPDLVIRFDRQLKHIFVNQTVEQELGMPLANIIGKDIQEAGIFPETVANDWMHQITLVFETQQPFNYYQEIEIKGDKRYLFTKLIPEFDLNKTQVESVLSVSRDISALKQIELELKHSEENWRSLVDNTPDLVSRFDCDLRYIFVNKAVEKEGGIPASEFIGKTKDDLGVIAQSSMLQAAMEKARDTLEAQNYYFQHKFRNGETKYYYTIIVPELTEHGKIKSLLLITRHITQLKQYELELLRSEHTWKSLVNNTPDLICRFDKNLNHRFVNEAMEKEFGIKAADIIGKNNLEAGFPAKHEAELLILDLQKVLTTGEIISHYTFVEQKGQIHYLFIRLVPEFEIDGHTVASVLTIARDITTLKNYEIELNRKNQELQRINEYLDNFVYAAAHDLQSPVVSLKILTRFINDPEHKDNQAMYVA
ncbi:MAG: CheR family methyltransferase, partial [Bacteroidota bacterium]